MNSQDKFYLCVSSHCRGALGLQTFVLLCPAFTWVLGIQTHIIRLGQQVHLPGEPLVPSPGSASYGGDIVPKLRLCSVHS